MTKFDDMPVDDPRAPKPAIGEVHQLPDSRPNFVWRFRSNIFTGKNMPASEAGAPSCYISLGWSEVDLNADRNNPLYTNTPDMV